MSSTYARAAAGFIVQRAVTVAGAMQKARLERMQSEMDAIANWMPCAAVPFGIARSPRLAWWRNPQFKEFA